LQVFQLLLDHGLDLDVEYKTKAGMKMTTGFFVFHVAGLQVSEELTLQVARIITDKFGEERCKQLQKEHFDYFVFGHRHLPLNLPLNDQARYINLGDWIQYFTYLEIGEDGGELKKWD
jgi:UDP-2,3-diacylglucosamine pyrophosphatase LpxH